ncbi:MAG TPA: GNAT family protein [Thermomicrobiales bacterium]|nr:GNAT family protein [Thermomicrobiales bacterium]
MTIPDILRGSHVRLDAVRRDDLPAIAAWWSDGAAQRRFDAIPAMPRSADHLEDWLEAPKEPGANFRFAIRTIPEDALAGVVQVDGILWNQRVGWVSLLIGEPAMRGKGLGHEAMELALRFAFHELNLHRIQLTVFSYNAPAISLYERLGFVREGSFREFLERDGTRYDMLLYGLLRPEWEAAQG